MLQNSYYTNLYLFLFKIDSNLYHIASRICRCIHVIYEEINSHNDALCVPCAIMCIQCTQSVYIENQFKLHHRATGYGSARGQKYLLLFRMHSKNIPYVQFHILLCALWAAFHICTKIYALAAALHTVYIGFIAYTIQAEKLKSLHLHIADFIYYVSMLNVWIFFFSLVAAGAVNREFFIF